MSTKYDETAPWNEAFLGFLERIAIALEALADTQAERD